MTSRVGIDTGGAAGELLAATADRLRPFLRPSGELDDPVFGEPTQYATAYYAYVGAALAVLSGDGSAVRGERRTGDRDADAAERGMWAALRHLRDPACPVPASQFSRDVGSPGYGNHNDFMWPPLLRGIRLLRSIGRDVDALAAAVAEVEVPEVFAERPPSNWSAVWMSGEQLRIAEGLSPHPPEAMDAWLAPFFAPTSGPGSLGVPPVDVETGFYHEPGLPNSYDLWTRFHLLDLLETGYAGTYRPVLERLLVTGTRRSLGVQLSTGSLASAHRSTGQLWNLTLQVCSFHRAARALAGTEPALAEEAAAAARRAFVAASGCIRPTGEASPVENVLPAGYRVGYELYTMDAHYVGLALGFLATALIEGFCAEDPVALPAGPRGLVEGEPIHRSLLHADGWSLHLNLCPAPGYDAFGIADLTLGLGRRLRFGGQVHYGAPDARQGEHRYSNQTPLTLGIAVHGSDRSIRPLAAATPVPGARRLASWSGRQLVAEAELDLSLPLGASSSTSSASTSASEPRRRVGYRFEATIDGDVVRIVESAGDVRCSLLVPYLRDRGDGCPTEVVATRDGVRLRAGAEVVAVVPAGVLGRVVHLPHGYESRHGLVGLVRLDLAEPGPVAYEVRRVA